MCQLDLLYWIEYKLVDNYTQTHSWAQGYHQRCALTKWWVSGIVLSEVQHVTVRGPQAFTA